MTMMKMSEARREEAARTIRRLDELSETAPQALVDELRAEARAAGLAYWRERQEPPEAVAERQQNLDHSRERERQEYARAVQEGRTERPGAAAARLRAGLRQSYY